MTLAPMYLADMVPLSPTGPCPKIATTSPPATLIFLRPFQAVPVPQEIAAPPSKDSSSGRWTRRRDGTRM